MRDLSSKVTQFFEFLSTQSLGQMANFLKEDARLFFPKTQPLIGKERILKFFQILFRQYPELTFTVKHTIAQQDKVAAHWRNKGINRKTIRVIKNHSGEYADFQYTRRRN